MSMTDAPQTGAAGRARSFRGSQAPRRKLRAFREYPPGFGGIFLWPH